jgi:hypothetical protein
MTRMEYTTVSARILKEIKQKLTENHVEISKIIQDALEAEVERLETVKFSEALDRAGRTLSKIDSKLVTQLIREDREMR